MIKLVIFLFVVLTVAHGDAYLPKGGLVRRSTPFRRPGVQHEHLSGMNYKSMVRLRGGSAPMAFIESLKTTTYLNPSNYFNSLFVLLMTAVVTFKGIEKGSVDDAGKQLEKKPAGVKSLQWRFLSVFWLLRMADWLQGPYFYDVYATKVINGAAVSANMISRLFLVGFASTGLLGPWIGKLVDKYGRRAGTITFSLLYTLGALSTKSSVLATLMLGRLMGGIGTSLLFSAPEAWMVSEHAREGHEGRYLGQTFGLAYAGDSLIAIVAGQLASIMAAKSGPTGPFTLSIPFLWVGAVLAALKWKENVAPKAQSGGGGKQEEDSTIPSALKLMKEDKRIVLVGAMQALFEGAMYVFVLQWCPAVREAISTVAWGQAGAAANTPFGKIFSCFMASCLFGSSLFGALQKRGVSTETIAQGMMMVAAGAMAAAVTMVKYASSCGEYAFHVLIAAFLVFEACVGMYFPSIGTLRGKYLPDSHRGVMMNIFGLPLNLIVVSVNLLITYLGVTGALTCSAATLAAAAGCATLLNLKTETRSAKLQSFVI